ncbi:MAG: O-antigen ligase family protein [Terriglobales bacterium]
MLLFYILISAMPLVRDPLWEHFMSDLTAVKYLGVACLAYAAWHCTVARRAPAVLGSMPARAMVCLCLWAAVSWLTLGAPIAWDKSPLLSYVSFIILLVITVSVVDSWPRLEHVLWAVILAVGIASLYIVREWQKYRHVYAHFRPGWVTGDPNYFTASALVGLPLALAFCGRHTAGWKRLTAAGCFLLTLVAVALAASRGGLLGLLAMAGWFAWKKRRLTLFVLAATLMLPPLVLWSRSPLNRLLHPSVSDIKSSNTRLALWQAGLKMVEQHPLTGIGLGQFKAEVAQYAAGRKDLDHIAHNTYLALASEMGLPGLLVYALMVGGAALTLARLRRAALAVRPPAPHARPPLVFRDDEAGESDSPASAHAPPAAAPPPWLADAALGMQGAILGFSVSAIFLSAQYTKLFWLLLAITAATETLRPRAATAAAAAMAWDAPQCPPPVAPAGLRADYWEPARDV